MLYSAWRKHDQSISGPGFESLQLHEISLEFEFWARAKDTKSVWRVSFEQERNLFRTKVPLLTQTQKQYWVWVLSNSSILTFQTDFVPQYSHSNSKSVWSVSFEHERNLFSKKVSLITQTYSASLHTLKLTLTLSHSHWFSRSLLTLKLTLTFSNLHCI